VPREAPAPLPPLAPVRVTDGDVTAARVGGVQVLVRRWPGAELVTAALAIRGGVQNVDARTQGVELLGLRTATTGGTESLPKPAFARRLSQLGSSLEAGAGPDYSSLLAKGLRADFEATLSLLLDVFLHPALPDTEVALQRERLLQELKREEESPDDALQALSQRLMFAGTPYANRPQGTEASVAGLTAEDVRRHLAGLRTQGRLLLVVVGDVDAEAVFAQVAHGLAALPAGGAVPALPGPVHFAESRLLFQARALPTTYL